MAKKEEKRVAEENSSKEGLGIVGFTLGVFSLLSLTLGLLSLLFFFLAGGTSIFLIWLMSLIGLKFCYVQQKNHKTKLGKMGLILNIIALIVSTVLIAYSMPSIIQYYKTAGTTGAVTA